MNINVKLHKKDGTCYAEGIYSEENFVVKKGGKVSENFADHIRGGDTAKSYRNNSKYVNEDGTILADCEFKSPSTAAQFVTGRSTNGYEAWKVDERKTLGAFLKEKGLR